jgi:hypothetical protein
VKRGSIDKIVSVPRTAISPEIGECDARELEAVDEALSRRLGMA